MQHFDWREQLRRGAPDEELANRLESAIVRFLENDGELLEFDANERSISHRLATYLQDEWPEWHVDCEYNRNGHEPKRLLLPVDTVETDDTEAKTVFPDIIVHRRGTPENHLAIEIKKARGAGPDRDRRKLEALQVQLGYASALLICFETGVGQAGIRDIEWVVCHIR